MDSCEFSRGFPDFRIASKSRQFLTAHSQMGWINSFAGPHVQNSTSTLEMFIYRVCKSHKLEASMAPEALMETKTGHRWYLLIQITPVPMHLRHWTCCCSSTNAVIFSDLRSAARIGICFNTMLTGQCCPVLIARLFFPPHRWFKKASQWSKKGQKFCMGSTASANNIGDPSSRVKELTPWFITLLSPQTPTKN